MIIEDNVGAAAGGKNGTEIEEAPQDLNNEPQPGDQPDFNGGGEDQALGEETPEMEGQPSAPAEDSKPDPTSELKEIFDAKFKELEEKIKPPEQPPRELTEEEWAKHEQEWGVQRQTIDRTLRAIIKAKNEIKEYVDTQFAEMRGDSALTGFSKDPRFPDAGRFKDGMKEFLADFDVKHHSNPKLLERAYWYARGKSSQKDMKTIRNSDEKNRQVIKRLIPGRSEGGSVPASGHKGLTDMERQAAEMLPGGEAEYAKLKNPRNRIIAI